MAGKVTRKKGNYWKGQNLRNLRHWWLIERFRKNLIHGGMCE